MKGILGKKLGMTQIFTEDGRLVGVTVIEAGPARVLQKKEKDKDGYETLQMGFDKIRKGKNVTKPMQGHFKKTSSPMFRFLKEIGMEGFNAGDDIRVDIFSRGEKISVTGTSKGKGFQGVMKRHNYSGGPGSHGSMFNRAPGSIGQSSYPSRVWKNKALPGHMGDERITTKNLKIVDIRDEQNLMLVEGAVPGANGGYLIIRSEAPVAVKEN
ncbi:MAG: 50S ribosomal protein L3 [Thermodesulfovibrionia bacterium]|jgi:large subunit ribosomal protein L3|nr:50S ribosomal protein L3 [Thermodesulfovibrionia bacterium]